MAHWPYNTTAWKRLRKDKLADKPLCEPCERKGKVVPANTVDHRLAINAGGEPFPPLSGLESMCPPCHREKTLRQDKPSIGKSRGLKRGCDADGNPLDPNHPFLAATVAEAAARAPTPGGSGEAQDGLPGDQTRGVAYSVSSPEDDPWA